MKSASKAKLKAQLCLQVLSLLGLWLGTTASSAIASNESVVNDARSLEASPPADQLALVTEVTILSPANQSLIDVPATTVILRIPTGAEVELSVNGKRSMRMRSGVLRLTLMLAS